MNISVPQYADAVLQPEKRIPDLDNDGIFLVELATGKSKLIVSYRQMAEIHPVADMLPDVYWWLNHIIFNCDSTNCSFYSAAARIRKRHGVPCGTHICIQ